MKKALYKVAASLVCLMLLSTNNLITDIFVKSDFGLCYALNETEDFESYTQYDSVKNRGLPVLPVLFYENENSEGVLDTTSVTLNNNQSFAYSGAQSVKVCAIGENENIKFIINTAGYLGRSTDKVIHFMIYSEKDINFNLGESAIVIESGWQLGKIRNDLYIKKNTWTDVYLPIVEDMLYVYPCTTIYINGITAPIYIDDIEIIPPPYGVECIIKENNKSIGRIVIGKPEKLHTDKLISAIGKACGYIENEDIYTKASISALKTEYEKADNLLNSKDITNDKIDAQVLKLENAIKGLKKKSSSNNTEPKTEEPKTGSDTEEPKTEPKSTVSTAALKKVIAVAEGKFSDNYTQESFYLLNAKLYEAKNALLDIGALTQEDVDSLTFKLTEALNNLERKPQVIEDKGQKKPMFWVWFIALEVLAAVIIIIKVKFKNIKND